MKFPPHLLLLLATILWGGNFVIGRSVTGQIPPVTLAFLRWCIAFLVFFPIVYKQVRRDWPIFREHWKILLVLGFTGVATYNSLVYIAVYHTTSINASLMNSLTSIFIYILSFTFLKVTVSKNQIIGTIISIIGVLFILSGGRLSNLLSFTFNIGDLIVLVAVLSWSIYTLLINKFSDRLPGMSTFLVTIVIGATILFPISMIELAISDVTITWSLHTILAVFYVGIFASIVAFLSWNRGVVKIGANKASIFLNFIPVFATIFATIFLGEQLGLAQIIGGLAVIGGVLLANRG